MYTEELRYLLLNIFLSCPRRWPPFPSPLNARACVRACVSSFIFLCSWRLWSSAESTKKRDGRKGGGRKEGAISSPLCRSFRRRSVWNERLHPPLLTFAFLFSFICMYVLLDNFLETRAQVVSRRVLLQYVVVQQGKGGLGA